MNLVLVLAAIAVLVVAIAIAIAGHEPRRRRGAYILEQRKGIYLRREAGRGDLERLARETRPIAGRPGWRVDAYGREWYSAAWLDDREELR